MSRGALLVSGWQVIDEWIADPSNSDRSVREVVLFLPRNLPFGSPNSQIESRHPRTGAYHIVDQVVTGDGAVRITWVASKTGLRVRFLTCASAAWRGASLT